MRTLPELYRLAAPSSIFSLWKSIFSSYVWRMTFRLMLSGFLVRSIAEPRFNSKFMSPGFSAVDTLSQDWRGENNWLCPPVSMVVDVIKHARACCSTGTLIVPEWPSAYFWPLLKPCPSRFASFVTDVVSLPKRCDLIIFSLVQVRRCFTVASRLFSSVAQNSQCWLYA